MITPSDSRCAICGVMAPNSDIAIIKTTSRSKWTGKRCCGDRMLTESGSPVRMRYIKDSTYNESEKQRYNKRQ